MLLVIDVGNTNIVLGVFDGDSLRASFRMTTDKERSRDEIGVMMRSFFEYEKINIDDIDGVIIASVVPQVMYSLENSIRKYLNKEPIVVGVTKDLKINILYENPREVGSDRLVNAIAAKKLYGAPIIIIDFGTATTFCAVNKAGDYMGGAILPGIKISLEALFQKAAKLPKVEILKPEKVIGTNTVSSIQSGTYFGYIGAVDNIALKMMKEMDSDDVKVIATGGLASLISSDSITISEINRNLTLFGLKFIFENSY